MHCPAGHRRLLPMGGFLPAIRVHSQSLHERTISTQFSRVGSSKLMSSIGRHTSTRPILLSEFDTSTKSSCKQQTLTELSWCSASGRPEAAMQAADSRSNISLALSIRVSSCSFHLSERRLEKKRRDRFSYLVMCSSVGLTKFRTYSSKVI